MEAYHRRRIETITKVFHSDLMVIKAFLIFSVASLIVSGIIHLVQNLLSTIMLLIDPYVTERVKTQYNLANSSDVKSEEYKKEKDRINEEITEYAKTKFTNGSLVFTIPIFFKSIAFGLSVGSLTICCILWLFT